MSNRERPLTKAARHRFIRQLLARRVISSQAQLAQLLAGEGFETGQATISRDLVELGAVRVSGVGGPVYMLQASGGTAVSTDGGEGSTHMRQVCAQVLVQASVAQNLLVLRTPPGAANFLASALDSASLPAVAGTVAGDDTVLVVCSNKTDAQRVREKLLALAAEGS